MKLSMLLIALHFLNLSAHSQVPYAVDEYDVILDNYDPVSYFDGQPIKGNEEFQTLYKNRIVYFSSETNKRKFMTTPEKFFPAYGGWCSISMVNKNLVHPDYSMYEIQDGALIFFSVKAFFNGKTAWNKDPEKNKIIADNNYSKLFFK